MKHAPKQKILVVDPDAAIRALIVALLRRDGYAADTAASADAALDLRRGSKHAAIVVDPRILGGEALLHALRDERADVSVNLIVMTTTDGFEPPYAHAAGVRAVLIKPFLIEDLAAIIASCCSPTN